MLPGSAESEGDGRPIGDTSSGIGEREQIANHEQRPFPPVGLAPGDGDGRDALRRKNEPGEDGECSGKAPAPLRSEEHTSELQSLMRNSNAILILKKTHHKHTHTEPHNNEYQASYR